MGLETHYIKVLRNESVKPRDILLRLLEQLGNETLSKAQVFLWLEVFESGHNTVQNLSHPQRRGGRVRLQLVSYMFCYFLRYRNQGTITPVSERGK